MRKSNNSAPNDKSQNPNNNKNIKYPKRYKIKIVLIGPNSFWVVLLSVVVQHFVHNFLTRVLVYSLHLCLTFPLFFMLLHLVLPFVSPLYHMTTNVKVKRTT